MTTTGSSATLYTTALAKLDFSISKKTQQDRLWFLNLEYKFFLF